MLIALILTYLVLVIIAAIRPTACPYSEFEMRRQVDEKAIDATLNWRRYAFRHEVLVIRRTIVVGLLVATSALSIAAFGWLIGLPLAMLIALTYGRVASTKLIQSIGQKIYNRFEAKTLQFAERFSPTIRIIGGNFDSGPDFRIVSREELIHLIGTADDKILKPDEKKELMSSLTFRDKIVRDYMTPRSVMEAIGVNELLGPLMLDQLHKTGHTHFPVMDGDIDHLVGILHIYSLFTIENKKSLKVRDTMEPRVYYIHEEQTLEDALSACIKHRRHLLVVVNEYRETVGVITIEDAVEQLIGRQIVDQFAEHDDLRVVAARNPRRNNKPKSHVDV